MPARVRRHRRTRARGLTVELATTAAEVREAQRLRFRVFAEELGARLPGAAAGVDCDRFDAYCDHLLVRDRNAGRIVGTYRMLSAEGHRHAGGWYCSEEFDAGRLEQFAAETVEVGRACVAPEYRSGPAITLLWAGLLQYVLARGAAYVIGCASIGTDDGGAVATSLSRLLLQQHLAAPEWRATPHRPFAVDGRDDCADPPIPGLLKGYLHLGARVCGAPAWDPEFRTADLLLMLPVAQANPRYVDRLLRAA